MDIDLCQISFLNSAFFAALNIHNVKYHLLVDTGSQITWLFCKPPITTDVGSSSDAVSHFQNIVIQFLKGVLKKLELGNSIENW